MKLLFAAWQLIPSATNWTTVLNTSEITRRGGRDSPAVFFFFCQSRVNELFGQEERLHSHAAFTIADDDGFSFIDSRSEVAQ